MPDNAFLHTAGSLPQLAEPMNQPLRKARATRPTSGLVNLSERLGGGALAEHLFQAMRRLITDGVWARGEKLPGSRLIASDAKVSRTTVLSAIDMLVSEGLLETLGRSGTYIAWARSTGPASGAVLDASALVPKEAPPFTVGAPGLDLFPLKAWRRLRVP